MSAVTLDRDLSTAADGLVPPGLNPLVKRLFVGVGCPHSAAD